MVVIKKPEMRINLIDEVYKVDNKVEKEKQHI